MQVGTVVRSPRGRISTNARRRSTAPAQASTALVPLPAVEPEVD